MLTRYERGQTDLVLDEVAAECPVTIVLNGEEFATLVCSPEHVEDLAIGYLASEGVLVEYAKLSELLYDSRSGILYADISDVEDWIRENGSKRFLTSCCGKSRQGFVFYSDARTVQPIMGRKMRLTYRQCMEMLDMMQSQSSVFKETGGVHNAALFDTDGSCILSRMDIGRHNALDKLYGYNLRMNMSLEGKVLAFSGRISSEILLKAAKMRCEVLLSKSAATDLAIELAEQLGITVAGFIRKGSLNVYSHPERLYEGE